MSKIVCIDSHIAIWGIKKQSEPSQSDMIEKTRLFLENIDKKGIGILIPSIVIAEILTRENEEKHPQILSIISDKFIIGDLNIGVAQTYAKILGKRLDEAKELRKTHGIRNDHMKFDHVVIATAIYYGASCIYGYDSDLPKFAKDIIEIKEIPAIAAQSKLFEENI